MESKKNILLSKTFWVNVIVAVVVPFIPAEYNNPVYIGYAVGALNIALRLISKGQVVLK